MKLRLPLLASMVVLGISFVAVAGPEAATKIVGVWQTVDPNKKDFPLPEAYLDNGTTLEFAKDGKRMRRSRNLNANNEECPLGPH